MVQPLKAFNAKLTTFSADDGVLASTVHSQSQTQLAAQIRAAIERVAFSLNDSTSARKKKAMDSVLGQVDSLVDTWLD
jgi:hypothetical protein